MKAVAMPMSATTHIHSSAPGPPMRTAMATPAMLPMPTRAARPTAKAWKEEIPPSAPPRERVSARTMVPKCRACTAQVRIVRYRPTAMSSAAST